ncbi:MAG: hypothetical protein ACRDP7_13220, partial [Trebonia sp.]
DLPPAVDEVFARVLAKRPGDRYGTCREFMIAAREALGPLAEPISPSGSLHSLMPRTGPVAYPGEAFGPYEPSQEAYPPAELAHESANAFHEPTAQWPAAETIPPSRPSGGLPLPPPPGPGSPRRRGRRRRGRAWLVALAALILVAGGAAGVTLSLTGGHGTPSAGGARTPTAGTAMNASSGMATPTTSAGMSSMAATAAANETPRTASCAPDGQVAVAAANRGQSGPTTLAGVLQQANLCSTPAGDLPSGKCTAQGTATMTCTSPVAGVAQVTFTTYTSRTLLYNAYQGQINLLNGSFQQDTMTHCGNTIGGYSETGWNHLEAHPNAYTVAQMESAGFNQVDAMGRQACFIANGTPYLVWTTDVGNMLAVAKGSGSMSALYNWWAQIHHVIIFRGTEMCGQNMGRMASVPQGNLISSPVCPSGVTPDTGTMPSTSASSSSSSGMSSGM